MYSYTVAFLTCASVALAQDDVQKRAAAELERQLEEMVQSAPARLSIEFTPVEDPNYVLEEAIFSMDGVPLKTPPVAKMRDDKLVVFEGDVKPGKHKVNVRLVYKNGASVIASDEGGFRWTVNGDNSFDIQSGILVKMQAIAKYGGKALPVKDRMTLALPAKPVMIAKLDDGSMPERPAPKPVVAVVTDAGVPEVAVKKTPAELRKEKAEEAKRLAEEKARLKAEQREAARLLAQEKRSGQAGAGGVGKGIAAAGKTASGGGGTETPAEPPTAAAQEPVDAGAAEAVAEPMDAAVGPPAVAVAEVKPVPAAVQVAETGPDGKTIGMAACGGIGLLLFILLLTRRKRD
jgi:hypothetical protein